MPLRKQNIYAKLPYATNTFFKGRYSFFCLNTAQFLGVLNDNIFKLITIFLLLTLLGTKDSSTILASVGALYVAPFLLFSAMAGVLADRLSKQSFIRILKGIEVILMLLAIVAFSYKSIWGSYVLLFLLATHSALFGPSKYGILPEIVEKQSMIKANGLIVSFTYLAMIIGTFLASFLTEITTENFGFAVSFCFLFALLGFIASFGIKKTPAQKSTKKIHPFFLREIVKTIIECRKTPSLVPCLFGSGYFLFIGAFTQLNIIPLAIDSLHLSEYAGGYIFLSAAFGIAIGSSLSNKLLKNKLTLNTSCFASLGLTAIFFFLWLLGSCLVPVCILLLLLGILGGIFLVPLDTFLQLNSSTEKRGQTIAAANFLGFFGVLLASFFLYLFGHVFGLSAAGSFFCMSLISVISTTFLILQFLETFLPSIALHFPLYKKKEVIDPLNLLNNSSIFLIKKWNFYLVFLALRQAYKCRFLFIGEKQGLGLHLLNTASCVHFLRKETSFETAITQAKALKEDETAVIVIFLSAPPPKPEVGFWRFLRAKEEGICWIKEQKDKEENIVIFVQKEEVL